MAALASSLKNHFVFVCYKLLTLNKDMDNIYSERELLPSGLSLGQWEFHLSDDEINEKLKSFPKSENDPVEDCAHWKTVFSIIIHQPVLKTNNDLSNNDSVVCVIDEPMECSNDNYTFEEQRNKNGKSNSDIEDITVSLVDNCNQIAKTLKPGTYCDKGELSSVIEDLQNLDQSLVSQVVDKCWLLLNSDASKMCFCVIFCEKSKWCEILCKQVLVPWLSKSLPSKLEQFSEIFSNQGEVFCKHSMVPLLRIEESLLVKDLLSFEEIMTSMSKKIWTILLKELLSGLNELFSWIIPVLSLVVEHSEPSMDELSVLVQLMSSTGSNFAKSREFGALLVAVATCINQDFSSVIPQIKLITSSYKGPLKFKVLKVLNDIKY